MSMSFDKRSSETERQAPASDGGRWSDTFVVHSSNRLIHAIRYWFYERAFFDWITDRNASILDVGCGSGEFINLLKERGFWNLHGVEVDDALIGLAAQVLPDVRKSSAMALPFPDNSFDCIYMFNVMHHLGDMGEYERSLAEMTRCTRDGGRIIMIEPCRLILYRMLKGVCSAGRPVSGFFRNFDLILQAEWPDLTFFLRHLDLLRKQIRGAGCYDILVDSKLLHQWITVLAVRKGGIRTGSGQAGSCGK
jgi:SAM-dependent methyltransferase